MWPFLCWIKRGAFGARWGGVPVAAHGHGADATAASATAGVDTIEHRTRRLPGRRRTPGTWPPSARSGTVQGTAPPGHGAPRRRPAPDLTVSVADRPTGPPLPPTGSVRRPGSRAA
ncbi:hypothetical protein C0R04_21265 [Streptomyces albidoflavus]|nr:hypothetical protein C0R04_21265 [Streptomyces albidoflavus]RZE91731.1 hypothetical protein C0R03_21280 [Streptomyces albidoflavus]